MNIETTTCACDDCNANIHTVTIPNDLVSFDGESFTLHLSDDELADLYFTLKEVQCQ